MTKDLIQNNPLRTERNHFLKDLWS